MTNVYMKDIVGLCNNIQSLSNEYIKENKNGCFNHGFIRWYNITPYTGKEIKFYFYKDDYKIVLAANNKKEMYAKLLKVYEKGLNSWMNSYNNDIYKTKRERYRLNGYKKKLIELNRVVDICYS